MIADKTTMVEKLSLLLRRDPIDRIYFAGFSEEPANGPIRISPWNRFFFTLSGCQPITVSIDGNSQPLKFRKGSVLYCPANVWVQQNWKSVYEMISVIYYDDHIRAIYINHKGEIDFPAVDYYYHTDHGFYSAGTMLLHSLNEMDNSPHFQESALDIVRAILKLTIIQLQQSAEYLEEGKARTTWREVSQYLHEHSTENIGREQIASHFGLNPDYLTRLFLRFSQRTFQQYLDDIRMQLAEKLLTQKNFSIKNIAKQCGYNSCSYFIRRFRKYYKTSPDEFRKTQ